MKTIFFMGIFFVIGVMVGLCVKTSNHVSTNSGENPMLNGETGYLGVEREWMCVLMKYQDQAIFLMCQNGVKFEYGPDHIRAFRDGSDEAQVVDLKMFEEGTDSLSVVMLDEFGRQSWFTGSGNIP